MNTEEKTLIHQKEMQILLGLRGFSIIKVNETQALWKINSTASITVDVSFPSKLWEVKHQGKKVDDWKTDAGLPVSIRNMIQALEDDFIQACAEVGITMLPDGKESVTSGRLEELRKELAEPPEKPETPDQVNSDNATECETHKPQPAEPTPKTIPANPNDPINDLIKILGTLLEKPTNPGFTRSAPSKQPSEEAAA